jgi:hypothetical protein
MKPLLLGRFFYCWLLSVLTFNICCGIYAYGSRAKFVDCLWGGAGANPSEFWKFAAVDPGVAKQADGKNRIVS